MKVVDFVDKQRIIVFEKNSSRLELFKREVNSMDRNVFTLGKYILKVHDRMNEKISHKYGISNFEINILFMLKWNPECDTARDLVEKMNLSKSNVSTAIDNLCKKGYLKGFQDEQDRRYIHLKIQEPAEVIIDEAFKIHDEFMNTITEGIPEEKLEMCKDVLEQLVSNLVDESKNM